MDILKTKMARTWMICGLLAAAPLMVHAAVPETAAAPATNVSFKPADVMAITEKVGAYQIATLAAGWIPPKASWDTPDPKGWVQGALFVGLTDMADHSDNPIYKDLILARGEANKWELGKRVYHADDHVIGQSYLWAVKHGASADKLKPMRATFDSILTKPSDVTLIYPAEGDANCTDRWCWCDALFMAPATWIGLSQATGDPRYAAFAKKEFWATYDVLYDKDEKLFYRDARFFERRGPNGEKVFWSRGDGWVFAGLARILEVLPVDDPDRPRFVALYKEMAAKIKSIQLATGYWAPSLLADPKTALPETSGTAFYTYGLAWGVRNGTLDRAEYEPAIRKGWSALVAAVHPDGKLGYVQPVSDRPDNVGYDDTQFYGVGAFLLAGTAVADLKLK
ncbi:glycoside hydrolase family 88/105 protein [Asticcacaulis sp.]|uniref:glycoside hydrolase family 88/105 protein n=1 Tax=Asticcacaulis sp. TaxID=1872648 RepID=UPI002CD2A8DE|nr:glycoside hydrolase family 88 protein [Asticcacaulis sp.]HTM79824.1 glycoside hydrolase family 88 protein [Asticcacaulis sp.]